MNRPSIEQISDFITDHLGKKSVDWKKVRNLTPCVIARRSEKNVNDKLITLPGTFYSWMETHVFFNADYGFFNESFIGIVDTIYSIGLTELLEQFIERLVWLENQINIGLREGKTNFNINIK